MKKLLFLLIFPLSLSPLYSRNDSSFKKNFSHPFGTNSHQHATKSEFEELLNKRPIIATKQAYYELKAAEQRSAAKQYGKGSLAGIAGGVALFSLGKYLSIPALEVGGAITYAAGLVGIGVTIFKFGASLYNNRAATHSKDNNNNNEKGT